jgi:hypothetical protein
MNDHPSHQGPGPSRKFIPDASPLESRLLLSRQVSLPDGSTFVVPVFRHLPRTGGVSVQNGTVLGIGVGQPTTNTVQVTDDGKGNIQAEWNGGPVHSLTGIGTTAIQAERARNDQITFHLSPGDTVSAMAAAAGASFHHPGPTAGSTAIELGPREPAGPMNANAGGRPLVIIHHARTSGTAVQTGSMLTVTVDKPTTNTVAISNHGGGAVEVEWNGGAVHSFTGVATIVVDAKHAGDDLVAVNDVTQ